ncbi:MAG: MFS transporter [Anaerolineales bacterium]|jgi:MFS family permease
MQSTSPNKQFIQKNLRYNLTVNLLDGGFFGFALGFASFITVIPLFVSRMTDSALLIGLVPAIHNVGWQFPQLLTAGWVSRAKRIKPLVLWTTIHERIPFLGLAAVAWFLPNLGTRVALVLTFILLIWQGFGGGFTANAWTSLMTKIMPANMHGTFFGAQMAAFTALEGISAVAAGLILDRLDGPLDFTLCFLAASISFVISILFLSFTREHDGTPRPIFDKPEGFWSESQRILKSNWNFVAFLMMRSLSQFAAMAFSFYIVYVVWTFKVSEVQAGYLTGVFLMSSILANLVLGRLADRWSPRMVMVLGALAASLSASMAMVAPSASWFYLSLVLASVAIVAIWTLPLPLTVQFGTEEERPYYIGLSSTITAPTTLLAPVLGGWLADTVSFQATFTVSIICGLLMAAMLAFVVKDPPREQASITQPIRIPVE